MPDTVWMQRLVSTWLLSMLHALPRNSSATYLLALINNLLIYFGLWLAPFCETVYVWWATSLSFLTLPYRVCCAGVLLLFCWPLLLLAFWVYAACGLWRLLTTVELLPVADDLDQPGDSGPVYVRAAAPELVLLERRQQQAQLQWQLPQQENARQLVLEPVRRQVQQMQWERVGDEELNETETGLGAEGGPAGTLPQDDVGEDATEDAASVYRRAEDASTPSAAHVGNSSSSSEGAFDPTDHLPLEYLAEMTFIKRREPQGRGSRDKL